MVERELPKFETRVRFPSPAPNCRVHSWLSEPHALGKMPLIGSIPMLGSSMVLVAQWQSIGPWPRRRRINTAQAPQVRAEPEAVVELADTPVLNRLTTISLWPKLDDYLGTGVERLVGSNPTSFPSIDHLIMYFINDGPKNDGYLIHPLFNYLTTQCASSSMARAPLPSTATSLWPME